jgi:glycosyltransferase involved in cell wall biosynthesis
MHSRGTERAVIRILKEFDRAIVSPELALVSYTGDFLADIPSDVPVHRLGLEGKRTSKAGLRLHALIKEVKPDVTVGVHTSASRLLSALRVVHRRLPVICFEADPFSRVEGEKNAYRARKLMTSITHRLLATRIIAVSDFVSTDIQRELRVPPSKIDVIPIPSVEPSMFEMAEETVDDPSLFSDPVIISLGHMFEHKDQQTLVRAFARVRSDRPVRLLMIGDGPLRSTLERLASDLGVSEDVSFLGFQKNPFKFLARAQVFVSPSASEGFDVSQVEAMACGLPVVVTDAPRFQAVTHGVNGLVVPPNNPEEMGRAILRMLEDEELIQTVVAAAMGFAEGLTSAKVTRQWERMLIQVTGRG